MHGVVAKCDQLEFEQHLLAMCVKNWRSLIDAFLDAIAYTPGGQCAYERDLFAIPIVATINDTTANLHLLHSDDWLSNPW